MARIFTVANPKGGVGKTDVAVNLSSCLADLGKKTLLIDIDPQSNATHYLLQTKPKKTVCDLLLQEDTKLKEIIYKTDVKNLFIVPGDKRLNAVRAELLNDVGMQFKLKKKLKNEKGYDYIIIDTPPSLDPLTINALTASHGVIVPVQVHYLAVEGMEKLMETVNAIKREINPKLSIIRYVLTMFDKRKNICREVAQKVKEYFKDNVFRTKIRENVRLAEAPGFGKTIEEFAPKSHGAEDYLKLTREIIKQEKRK